MDLYLDTADRAELEPLLATGLFRGVTTNPLILARSGVRLDEVPDLVAWLFVHGAGEVFVQTTTESADAIEAEGHRLRGLDPRVVVKVPATREGLTAVRRLSDAGVPTLVTAVHNPRQAILAASAGASWIAPYLGRVSEAGRDGLQAVAQMVRVLAGTSTRTLVASVRSAEDTVRLATDGAEAATLSGAVARELFVEPLTDAAVAQFSECLPSLGARVGG
ncbi:MAG: hypothetical protein BGO37_01530 [Cellulomonas sp. 73-92]|uniref:transaldolase family protein n=1 Tax=Cellulomonas sp. 73-92 TaxID=1895740 RepID=UPI00092B3414|nr:transaldolase family protein [Cellulomonas sp. 73-92]OJV75532.1 MAG: hypothetical protein BGO37_01530 [Cellulomonas sp. 73-92]